MENAWVFNEKDARVFISQYILASYAKYALNSINRPPAKWMQLNSKISTFFAIIISVLKQNGTKILIHLFLI